MAFYFPNFAGGALIGALLASILLIWVKIFVTQVYAATPKNSSGFLI